MLINSQLCPGVQGMDVIREINARACGLLISDLCNFMREWIFMPHCKLYVLDCYSKCL